MANRRTTALACFVLVLALIFPHFVYAAKTHRVKRHETLAALAKRYHVSVAELKTANNLVHSRVKPGDVLVIPPRNVAADDGEAHAGTTYKVKKGETLTKISKKSGVTVAELKRLNRLRSVRLKPGQVLVLKRDDQAEESKPHKSVRNVGLYLKYSELLNEKDYEQSLADLTEPDPSKPVDLSKNVELKVDNVKLLKTKAYGFLGIRYRFGGSSKSGIDCSSFVQQVFRQMDVSLPRTAREQFEVGSEVAPGDLQKGDLVFFRTYAHFPSHVGIYLGDNKMIHASSRDRRVVISTMNTSYYRSRFIGAKRIAKINPETFKWDDLIAGVEEESADDAISNDSLGLSMNK